VVDHADPDRDCSAGGNVDMVACASTTQPSTQTC